MLKLCPSTDEPWVWDLFEAAPSPALAARLSEKKVAKILGRHRILRIGAGDVRAILTTPPLQVAPGTAEAASAHALLLLRKAGEVPGVSTASIASLRVMRGTGMKATFGAAVSRITPSNFLNSSVNQVTPGYFETMGMRLLAGRAFTWFDRNAAIPRKVIVNRTFARRFFPGKNPNGERFGFPGAGDVAAADNEIVGVVSDAKYRSLREPIPPTVYSRGWVRFHAYFAFADNR